MSRFKNVSLVKVASVMIVGGLIGDLAGGGIVGYFGIHNPALWITLMGWVVLFCLFGGVALIIYLGVSSIHREWGSGSKSELSEAITRDATTKQHHPEMLLNSEKRLNP